MYQVKILLCPTSNEASLPSHFANGKTVFHPFRFFSLNISLTFLQFSLMKSDSLENLLYVSIYSRGIQILCTLKTYENIHSKYQLFLEWWYISLDLRLYVIGHNLIALICLIIEKSHIQYESYHNSWVLCEFGLLENELLHCIFRFC